jgi:hypothetical protein
MLTLKEEFVKAFADSLPRNVFQQGETKIISCSEAQYEIK